MGGGNFGVEAASEFYFGKSVKDVNLAEAAMLAGLFKAPARYAPHINLPAARARANEVLSNMVQAGFLTEGQVIGARRNPADVIDRASAAGSPDYFLDWAFEEVKKLRLGGDRSLIVRTTVDLGMQKAAEEAVETVMREQGDTYGVKQAAVVAMDADGAVRAMVGGRDYGESQFNRATDALRQPGSSFKPYVYATGDDERLHAGKRRSRRADLHGQLVPAELLRRLFRRGHADHGAGQVDQHRAGAARQLDRGRPRQDHRAGATGWGSGPSSRAASRCRSARPR